MVSLRTAVAAVILVPALLIGYFIVTDKETDVPVPEVYRQNHYWGKKNWVVGETIPPDDQTIKPFQINIAEQVLVDLKSRLKNTRYQDSFPGLGFEYGMPSEVLKSLIDHWLNKYDWRAEEKNLNQFKHFKTQIEGIDVHFVHVKPLKREKISVPLLIVHGWPGSFYEFYKMIPLLTGGPDINFELIIPSIPGFGFSEAPHRPGLHGFHVARMFAKLMKRLGHEKFIYQGGDWGSIIGNAISVTFPERVLGFHSNFPSFRLSFREYLKLAIADYGYPGLVYDNPANESQIFSLSQYAKFVLKESGYFHIQATFPDTVGYGLNDSPAALAAYILEKFRDPLLKGDGKLTQGLSFDELLTNVMIYWINNCMTSAARFYKEQMAVFGESYIIKVPYAADTGKYDIPTPPLSIIKKKATNIRHYRKTDIGGHFLAFEQPMLLAAAIRNLHSVCFRKNNKSLF